MQCELLEQGFQTFQTELLAENSARNNVFFDEEMEKLDHWAGDQKSALYLRLSQLEQEIKSRKTTARKLTTLADKLAVQQIIKRLEAQRNELRVKIFTAQDEVDARKDELLDDIERRMAQEARLLQCLLSDGDYFNIFVHTKCQQKTSPLF